MRTSTRTSTGFANGSRGTAGPPTGRGAASSKPGAADYQIYTLDLEAGARPRLVSTGRGKCTCSYYHPSGKSILYASTHLDPALASGAGGELKAKKGPAYSRSERYRWDFDPAMDIFRAAPDG